MSKPTHYTAEEVRSEFLAHLRYLCKYWSAEPQKDRTERERMESLCHSILVIFDGETGEFPAMNIGLAPHASDKQFHIEEGSRWYMPGMVINDCMLHEEWYAAHRARKAAENAKPTS